MAVWRLAFVSLVVVGLAVAPAGAGTQEDPEVTSRCGDFGEPQALRLTPGWVDVCAGWFETLSGADDEVVELRFSLRVAEDVALRTPSRYSAHWRSGDCGFGVLRLDAIPPGEAEDAFLVSCGDPEPDCTVDVLGVTAGCESAERIPLPPSAWAEDGDVVSWTLRFEGALADYAAHFSPGSEDEPPSELSAPNVLAAPAQVGPFAAWTASCQFGSEQPTTCQEVGGNFVIGQRGYTIGS